MRNRYRVKLKRGEVEAMLDLLLAIENKDLWVGVLHKNESRHVQYFPDALKKTISMFQQAIGEQPTEEFNVSEG